MANKSFAVDHIDLVSSDLKDFMDNCDLDDLMSRPGSRPNASASPLQPYRHSKDGLTRLERKKITSFFTKCCLTGTTALD